MANIDSKIDVSKSTDKNSREAALSNVFLQLPREVRSKSLGKLPKLSVAPTISSQSLRNGGPNQLEIPTSGAQQNFQQQTIHSLNTPDNN